MATTAAATASDVDGAGNGSLHLGQVQNTAGLPADSGLTGNGLKMPVKRDESGELLHFGFSEVRFDGYTSKNSR